MPTYNMFKFKIKPMPSNELYARVSGGSAVVTVDDLDAERALKRAKDYVGGANWELIETVIRAEAARSKYRKQKPQNQVLRYYQPQQ